MTATELYKQRAPGILIDLIKAIEARRMLDDGFNGMGYNILIESANRYNGLVRQAQKLIEDMDQEQQVGR